MTRLLFIPPRDSVEAFLATGAYAFARARVGEAAVVAPPRLGPLFPDARMITPSLAVRFGIGGEALSPDWLVDCSGRSSLFLHLRARKSDVRKAPKVLRHRVEEFSELVGADSAQAPILKLDEAAGARASAAWAHVGPFLALLLGAEKLGARWAGERFAAAARRLTSLPGPLQDAPVALLGNASERDLARTIAASLDADGVSARVLAGELDLKAAGALLQSATLALGNDNLKTHIAAAQGAPTLMLFGPTDERVRGPVGARARALRGRAFAEIAAAAHGADVGKSWLEDISVDAVEEAALDLMRAGGLR